MSKDDDFLADFTESARPAPDRKAVRDEAQAKHLQQDGYKAAGLTAKDYEPTEENKAAAHARAESGQDTNCGTDTIHTYKHCLEKILDFYREAYDIAPEDSATFVEARNAFRMTISERTFFNTTLPSVDQTHHSGAKVLRMDLPATKRPTVLRLTA